MDNNNFLSVTKLPFALKRQFHLDSIFGFEGNFFSSAVDVADLSIACILDSHSRL